MSAAGRQLSGGAQHGALQRALGGRLAKCVKSEGSSGDIDENKDMDKMSLIVAPRPQLNGILDTRRPFLSRPSHRQGLPQPATVAGDRRGLE